MLLGVIADDLTGATDVALMLAREGMHVVQTVGVPLPDVRFPDADAIVISMKSRTNPATEAVEWSLTAATGTPFAPPPAVRAPSALVHDKSSSNIARPSIRPMPEISAS